MTQRLFFLIFFVFSSTTSIACTHIAPPSQDEIKEEIIAIPPPCNSSSDVSETCSIDPNLVHPTQFALGLRDVVKKRAKISEIKNNPKQLNEYLKKKSPPAIKGPEDVFYIVDGHHTSRALAEESVKTIYIKISKDYSDMTISDFWDRMKSENYVWLYDEEGVGPKNPIYIPDSILDLKDDPYRSLAEDAKQKGAYEERPVLFQQFYWANYFRPLIPKEKLSANYDDAVNDAVKAAKLPEASQLPGFRP